MTSKYYEALKAYYFNSGLLPHGQFYCTNKTICDSEDIILAHCMQAHLGSKYGEKTRILVVSLDSGGGGIMDIDERTQTIENLKAFNPHMKGTAKILLSFLGMSDPNEAFKYFAMTNSCKCSRNNNSMNQLPSRYYERCTVHKTAEIEILDPEIVFFQGSNDLTGLKFTSLDLAEDIDSELSKYLKFLHLNNKRFLSVLCPHPSAYGRNYKHKVDFYERILLKINKFVKERIRLER